MVVAGGKTNSDYIDDAWFIAGNLGTLLASPDSTNWFGFSTPTKKSLYGLTIHDGQMIAVGTEGAVLRSQLVPDPTPIRIAGFGRASGYNVLLFTGGVDQLFRLQSSTNLTGWNAGALLEFLDGTGTLLYAEDTGTNAPAQTFYRTVRER
jgi:hypothetical protein